MLRSLLSWQENVYSTARKHNNRTVSISTSESKQTLLPRRSEGNSARKTGKAQTVWPGLLVWTHWPCWASISTCGNYSFLNDFLTRGHLLPALTLQLVYHGVIRESYLLFRLTLVFLMKKVLLKNLLSGGYWRQLFINNEISTTLQCVLREPYPLLLEQRLVLVVQRLPSLYGLVTETMRTVAAVHRVTEGQRLSGSFTVGLESAGHLPVSKVRYHSPGI